MKKISYYIISIVAIGSILVCFWIYQKYFKKQEPDLLLFKVETGSIQEAVKIRGEVVSEKEFNLEFPFDGIVEEIFAQEGQTVNLKDPLIKLETIGFELETVKLQTQLAQANADLKSNQAQLNQYQALLEVQKAGLAEIKRGTREEEIQITETKLANFQKALLDDELNLENIKTKAEVNLGNLYDEIDDILQDAFFQADDAVNKQIDNMFENDDSSSVKLSFITANSQAMIDVESQRITAGSTLKKLKSQIDNLADDYSSLEQALTNTQEDLIVIRNFLTRLMDAVNAAISISQTTINTYQTDINTARANLNTAIENINNHQQAITAQKALNKNNIASAEAAANTAQNSLAAAEAELAFKKAGPTPEQIQAKEAQVRQAEADIMSQKAKIEQSEANIQNQQAQIAIIQEKINKSILYAPIPAKVVKIWLEKQELFRPGQTVITLAALAHKVQTDVSELEIRKIRDINPEVQANGAGGNDVLIQLDAFPGENYKGRVISIEPKAVIEEGDKYYRVNVYLEEHEQLIRSGMSADLIIIISSKDNVLKIPEFAIYQKQDKKFVTIFEDGRQKEAEIETGISDGENIEIKSGLEKGQTIAVSAD